MALLSAASTSRMPSAESDAADQNFAPFNEQIPSQSYFDLTLTARIGDHYNFRLGVNNILDREPPIIGANGVSTVINACPGGLLGQHLPERLRRDGPVHLRRRHARLLRRTRPNRTDGGPRARRFLLGASALEARGVTRSDAEPTPRPRRPRRIAPPARGDAAAARGAARTGDRGRSGPRRGLAEARRHVPRRRAICRRRSPPSPARSGSIRSASCRCCSRPTCSSSWAATAEAGETYGYALAQAPARRAAAPRGDGRRMPRRATTRMSPPAPSGWLEAAAGDAALTEPEQAPPRPLPQQRRCARPGPIIASRPISIIRASREREFHDREDFPWLARARGGDGRRSPRISTG